MYRFSLAGELLNALEIEGKVLDRAMESGQYTTAYYLLDGRAKAGTLPDAQRAFLQGRFTRLTASSAPPEYRAKCFKYLGELALMAGDKKQAAGHFRAALELNPKIGLKRRLAELEKENPPRA